MDYWYLLHCMGYLGYRKLQKVESIMFELIDYQEGEWLV
jgi:hypothetical protein